MTAAETFVHVLMMTPRAEEPGDPGPDPSYDEVAADVAAVRRLYAVRGWDAEAEARDELEEIVAAYVEGACVWGDRR